jgi:hypothetical protein
MRLPRMTMRRLRVAVAVVALLATAWILVRRSRDFARQARFHSAQEEQRRYTREAFAPEVEEHFQQEQEYLKLALAARRPSPNLFWMEKADKSHRMAEECQAKLDALSRQGEYHARLRRRYERAATRPWEHVPPNPPEPPYPQFGEPITGSIGDLLFPRMAP